MSKADQNVYPESYVPLMTVRQKLPASETSFMINLLAMAAAFVIVIAIKIANLGLSTPVVLAVFAGVMSAMVWTLEYIRYGKKSFAQKWMWRRKISWSRVGFKLLGLACVFAVLAFGYWVLPVYKDQLFVTYLEVLRQGFVFLVLVSVLYFILMDKIEEQPENAYWQLGRWLTGHRKDAHKPEMVELFRGWGVKFFYLAVDDALFLY